MVKVFQLLCDDSRLQSNSIFFLFWLEAISRHDRTGFFFHLLETHIYYYCLSVIIRLKEYFHDNKASHKYYGMSLKTDCVSHHNLHRRLLIK